MKKIILIFCFFLIYGFRYSIDNRNYTTSDIDFKYSFYLTKKAPKSSDGDKTYYWYKSRNIFHTVGDFDGELLDGLFIKSFRSNQLAEKGIFKKGLKHGSWMEWHENGNIKLSAIWDNGIKIKKYNEYNDQGKLLITGGYFKGEKNKRWINYITADTLYYKKGELLKEKPKSLTLKTKLFFNKLFEKDSLKPKKTEELSEA